MAKEIAPTPVLEGEDAYCFLKELLEPANDEERTQLEEIVKKDLPKLF